MEIIYNDINLLEENMVGEIERAISIALKHEGVEAEEIEISLSLVLNDEIKKLNHQYREKDVITDVLSFPQYNSLEEIQNEKSFLCLGDIVISLDKVKEQAIEYEHTFERELLYLTIHSVLHLLGYDHMNEQDKSIMREREKNIMRQIGVER